MKVKSLSIELMVDDMKKSIDFYESILDFKVSVSVPEENPFFVILKNGSLKLMLYLREEFRKEISKFEKMKTGGSVVLYVEVEGIESYFERVKGKVKIIQTLYKTGYGTKEFSFEDNSGYVVMLAEKT